MCTAKGSDVRPGVPWGSAAFAWQVWGQCALPRGRMYALASLGAPPLLRGRRGTMCTAKGSDVRPGVPWGSASFAWQAWDNVHCQGVGCTPWRPLGLRRFCVAGVGQCALPRGWMYALASLGAPQCALPRGRMYALASLGAPPLLRGRRGTMCTAKGSDVRPGVPWGSASFARQAWDNVHGQGVGCTPWRPLRLRRFCVAGVGQCALPRGLEVRPGSAAFVWQEWDNRFCVAGVGQCALPRDVRRPLPKFCIRSVLLPSSSRPPHSLTHSLTHPPTHPPTHSLPPSLPHSLTHSLSLSLSRPRSHHSHTPHSHHSFTLSLTHLYMHIHTHTHTPSPPSPLHHPSSLTHHRPSITLILPLPFLLFYAQPKSKEVGNMWGYPVL